MRPPHLSPAAYQRVTLVALWLLAAIIVTGGTVRLTGSGLGCSDWPNCEPGQFVPRSELQPWIEFANRLVTGLVSAVVIVAVLGALVRRPRRRDLVVLALGLIGGVVLQIALGALVVKELLAPPWVMAHFLVSLLLVWNAVVLHRRASEPPGPAVPRVGPGVVWLGRALVLSAMVVVVTGTFVTGAGPHSGDEAVERLALFLPDVARVHGTAVVVFLALVLGAVTASYRLGAPASVRRDAAILLIVAAAQAVVGYTQYFTELPEVLVAIHIAGATAVWIAVLRFHLGLFQRSAPGELASSTDGRRPALAGT